MTNVSFMQNKPLIVLPFGLNDPKAPLPEWKVSTGLTGYEDAMRFMHARVEAISKGEARELIWLLEHPALYTSGISAKPSDLLAPDRFSVFQSDRGGQYTYHGPGQRVVYVLLDLNRRQKDVRAFVVTLENWLIDTLMRFNVKGHIREGRVGVWVERRDKAASPLTEDKIAAIGIKLKKWVSFHGISLNVEPDMSHFEGIIPCGISQYGVTSLIGLGLPVTMNEVDHALKCAFEAHFGGVEG